jgi:hypothetical protein
VAPHEDKEDSQSYYFENSEEEDMQSAYQLQYVEFLKLREKYKQQVLELNSLRTEKTSMLIVRTVSGMVAEELEEPISAILQNRRLHRGESDNPTPMILSILSQVYITLNHDEQSNLYLFSREVFIHKMFRAIRFFYWTTCQIRRVC